MEDLTMDSRLEEHEELNEDYRQYLTFMLGTDLYGISVDMVKEVNDYDKVLSVPLVPGYIRGIMNLRGEVVPVIDLYSLFFGTSNEVTRFTSIVIVELMDEGELVRVGIVIDSVREVMDIPEGNIEATPGFGLNIRQDHVDGVGKVNDSFVILLNIENVLNITEIAQFDRTRERIRNASQ